MFSSRTRADHWWLFLVLFAAVLPNIIWSVIDKTAWPWDQAWYAKYSVELFFTLIYSPSEWPSAMLNAFGRQAPGIAWAGQFFVPVGLLTGSIDTGLLLSIVCAQFIALFLMARALWELSERRLPVVLVGVVVMAAAPLFIGLSHYYLVEMMQTTAVAWFVFIMARAPKWSRTLIAGQLLLATAFAMLSKVSSPLFCFGPGLVALFYAVRPGQTADSPRRSTTVATAVLAIPIAAATAAWYSRNLEAVIAHVSLAASGPVAELYGKSEQFLPSLRYWLAAVYVDFFSPLTIVVIAGIVCATGVAFFMHRDARKGNFFLAAAVGTVQIAIGLSVFSVNSNRDVRYLLPFLPYVGLIVSWCVARLDRQWIARIAIAAFAVQWGHAQAQALGLIKKTPDGAPWLNPVMTNPHDRTLLDALVARTCADTDTGFYWNAIGVQLLWLNAPGVSYAAAKRFAPAHRLICDYDAIAYYDTDENTAWSRLMSRNVTYHVGLEASSYATPETPVDKTVNALNERILDRVETSGVFQAEAGMPEHSGVLILKRTDRVDHVAKGRALSDRGRHEQAIEELTRATALDPAQRRSLGEPGVRI